MFRICLLIACLLGASVPSTAQSQRAPSRPVPLDKGIGWHRDPTTSELHVVLRGEKTSPPSGASADPHALRVRTQMVAVTCTVSRPDGTAVPGLRREDFRVRDDGVERPISY